MAVVFGTSFISPVAMHGQQAEAGGVYYKTGGKSLRIGNGILTAVFDRRSGQCIEVRHHRLSGNLLAGPVLPSVLIDGAWTSPAGHAAQRVDAMRAAEGSSVTAHVQWKMHGLTVIGIVTVAAGAERIQSRIEMVNETGDTMRLEAFRFSLPWQFGKTQQLTVNVPGPFFPSTFVAPHTPFDSLRHREISFHSAPDAGFGVLVLSHRAHDFSMASWMNTGGEVNYIPRLSGKGKHLYFQHDDLRYAYVPPGDTARSDMHITQFGARIIDLLDHYRRDVERTMPMDSLAYQAAGNMKILEVYPAYYQGGFREITQRLPAYQSAGFNTIYLMPHWLGGYSPIDLYAVDPQFGTEEDLRTLVDTAHSLGMKVLFDMVIHGFHPSSPVVKQRPEIFVHNVDGSLALHPTWKSVSTDWASNAYQDYMVKLVEHDLHKYNIDGYRIDAASYKGPNWDKRIPYPAYRSGADAPVLMKRMLTAMRARKPDCMFLNEVFGPVFYSVSNLSHDNQTEAVEVLMKKMTQGAYTAADYREHVQNVYAMLPPGANRVFFARNHDTSWFYHFSGYTPLFFCFEAVHAFFGIPEVFAGDPKYPFNPDDDPAIYHTYRKIFAASEQHEEFRRGAMLFEDVVCRDRNIFTGVRSYGEESSIVLINMSDQVRTVDVLWKGVPPSIESILCKDVLEGNVQNVPCNKGMMRITLKPFQIVVGKAKYDGHD